MQRQEQGSLQKAQCQDQIGMEGRRQRVAMVGGLDDGAAGFAHPRVIHRHADQAAGTIAQGLFEQRGKQLLGIPLGARMQKVISRPTALLTAIGPQDARQRGAAQHQQGAQRLMLGPAEQAALSKDGAPTLGESQEGLQEQGWEVHHLTSASKAKVFFSGREKRSWRATFLLSAETRLSRSTLTPKACSMRSMICETCSGERARLSMS